MNIKEAKNEIIHTLAAYLKKDEAGRYTYPRVRQRPILLIGPPGIGKTAIMEQIAQECQVGLVAYTITHHTRQSAVGLPKIVSKCYGGVTWDITEYTMSEIIASVYESMEKTGKKEGILFIDEINCVSETLAPAMLQFLQNKTFGTHKVPEGWVIVAAGNPAKYNKSVREFDIVTLDRVRKIEIEAEADVWLEYARKKQIHGAILSYLEMKKDCFYTVENTVDGSFFVTARGWEDLSELLKSYEELGVSAGKELMGEFLQKEEIAGDFASYYELYQKYKKDYQIPEILKGTIKDGQYEKVCKMAKMAEFEERFTVTELVLDSLDQEIGIFAMEDKKVTKLHELLVHLRTFLQDKATIESIQEFIENTKKSWKARLDAELLTEEEAHLEKEKTKILETYFLRLREEHITDTKAGFDRIKALFQELCREREKKLETARESLENAFAFLEECFGTGQELLLLETGLTGNTRCSTFISRYGCPAYFRHCGLLLYKEKEQKLQEKCRTVLSKSQKENTQITK